MNEEVTVFNNESFGSVRTLEINNEVWFIGKDVAEALGYEASRNAIAKFVHEDDKLTHQISASGQARDMIFINESGLYALIFGSKLEKAKEFKHWVTSEVLPAIRKTGSYHNPSLEERRLKIEEDMAVLERAKFISLAGKESPVQTYKDICTAVSVNMVAGANYLPMPEKEKTYTATEIGKMLNVSAQKVGHIANENKLKTKEYGSWIWDRARNGKQIENFVYNEKALGKIKECLSIA